MREYTSDKVLSWALCVIVVDVLFLIAWFR